jgi:hypothetical protein
METRDLLDLLGVVGTRLIALVAIWGDSDPWRSVVLSHRDAQ